MKNLLWMIVLLAVAVPTAQATLTLLPDSDYIDGVSVFNTGTIAGYIEYAVYDTTTQQLTGYDREERFVYAYQIFHTGGADIDAIAILGFDPLAVTADSLDASDELGDNTTGGVDATALLDTEDVEALYIFDGGAVVAGSTSWFLLMYSDYDWVKGSYEINPADTDITVPGQDTDTTGGGDTNVPEPATLVLLLGGGLVSLIRRK